LFAILFEYGGRALPLPILASLLGGLSIWSWEQWPYYLAANLLSPLGYVVAAYALRRYPGGRRRERWYFNDPQQMAAFLAAAAAGSLFSALVGTQILNAAGLLPPQSRLSESVLSWWVGDFVGVSTFAPLLLIYVRAAAAYFRGPSGAALAQRRRTGLVPVADNGRLAFGEDNSRSYPAVGVVAGGFVLGTTSSLA